LSSQLVLVVRDFPFPASVLRAPMSFFFPAACLLFSLFLSLGGSWSVQGAMLIWPRFVCGNTACRLAHPVVCFSQQVRCRCLAVQEPSWFLRLTWSGDAMR
jgi:hypothetical protein